MPKARTYRRARLLAGGIGLALLSALAAGCSTTGTSEVDARDYDFRARHPILISDEPENMTIPVGMKGPALSPQIETAIGSYVDGYRASGTGGITIQVPTGSANENAAASTGRAVHYALVRAGVPHRSIRVAPYPVDDPSRLAPLRISYLRVKAVVPHCGIWPDGTVTDYRNVDYPDYGCAQAKNLAAMVANPADLIRPQPMTPADGARRAKVINDYGQGKDTKSDAALIATGTGG